MDTYYTVYQITNKINGRIYIGCHKTNDLDDGYMGSGKVIKQAISKYGIENFEKKILEVFDNPEDMFRMESVLVDHLDPNTYNIKEGGKGGFDHINNNRKPEDYESLSRIGNEALRQRRLDDPDFTKREKEQCAVAGRMGGLRLKELGRLPSFEGQKHNEESKRKIGEANKKLVGRRNSQYGTMWITNGRDNKKLKKKETIPDGWYKGRTLKRD